jgi:hypothetical protein
MVMEGFGIETQLQDSQKNKKKHNCRIHEKDTHKIRIRIRIRIPILLSLLLFPFSLIITK